MRNVSQTVGKRTTKKKLADEEALDIMHSLDSMLSGIRRLSKQALHSLEAQLQRTYIRAYAIDEELDCALSTCTADEADVAMLLRDYYVARLIAEDYEPKKPGVISQEYSNGGWRAYRANPPAKARVQQNDVQRTTRTKQKGGASTA